MNDCSAINWVVLAVSALVLGISKTGLPGIGILAIPMVAMVLPARASTGLILPMLIVGDIFAVAFYRRHAVWSHLVRLLPFAVAGVITGYFAMKVVTDDQLRPIIGGIILVMLALNYLVNRSSGSSLEQRIPTGWWFPATMGFTAGVTTMMANAAGPIMIIYLLAMHLPKNEFIGTGAWYFMLLNSFKIPFSMGLGLITLESLKYNLILAPVIVVGAVLGVWLVKHVPQKAFTALMQILAAAAAVILLLHKASS
jgi:hypothetical protein